MYAKLQALKALFCPPQVDDNVFRASGGMREA
jgi:hypothetical protein